MALLSPSGAPSERRPAEEETRLRAASGRDPPPQAAVVPRGHLPGGERAENKELRAARRALLGAGENPGEQLRPLPGVPGRGVPLPSGHEHSRAALHREREKV